MKIKRCKYCGSKIAKNARICPKCGGVYLFTNFLSYVVIFIINVIFIFCLFLSSYILIKEKHSNYEDQNGITSFNVGDTFESKYIKIFYVSSNTNFKDYNNLDIQDGHKIIEYVFMVENVGTKNHKISTSDFICYADDIVENQINISNESKSYLFSSGKKALLKIYCEVPKEANLLTVEYIPPFTSNVYNFVAKQEFIN